MELQAAIERPLDIGGADPQAAPMRYLHGEHTRSPSFLDPDAVRALFPHADVRAVPGQRHLAPVLDPTGFATAVLDFTTAVDGAPASAG
jgi:hypothetical protein